MSDASRSSRLCAAGERCAGASSPSSSLLTIAFLVLYGSGHGKAFEETEDVARRRSGVEAETLVGATLFGLSMFATLFLGTVLAVFLTLGAVRGDAERGLLQPLVVRPLGRTTFLLGRFAGAAARLRRLRARRLLRGAPHHARRGRLVARPDRHPGARARRRGGDRRRALAARLRRSSPRRRTGSPSSCSSARASSAGLLGQIGEALDSDTLDASSRADVAGAAVRGALPGWRCSALTADSRGVTALRGRARPVRRREGLRRLAAVVGGALRRRGAGRGCLRLRPARPLIAASPATATPGRAPAAWSARGA